MNKQQLIGLINEKISDGTITSKEIISMLKVENQFTENNNNQQIDSIANEKKNISEKIITALYVIGSVIILSGILILLLQYWSDIGFAGRILVTIGVAITAYFIAFFTAQSEHEKLSQIMFLVSAIVFPIGVYVWANEVNYIINTNFYILSTLVFTIFYGLTQSMVKNRILVIVTMFYATVLYFSSLFKIFEMSGFNLPDKLIEVAVIFLGLAYFSIAYGYESLIKTKRIKLTTEENSVSKIIFLAASLAVLIPIMTFRGIWDFLVIFVIFAIAYLSFFIESKFIFFVSALFLIIQITIITSRYFANYTGWPVALIGVGIFTIAIAFISIKLSNRITDKN